MSVVLGGIAVVLGFAGAIEFSPWLAAAIVLGVGIESAGFISRRRKDRARRYGSQVAALRQVNDIRLLGNEHSAHRAA